MGLISRVSSRTYRDKKQTKKKWFVENVKRNSVKSYRQIHVLSKHTILVRQEHRKKLGGNKLLEAKKRTDRFDEKVGKGKQFYRRCRLCELPVHQKHFRYCQKCAYMKAICPICGKRVISK